MKHNRNKRLEIYNKMLDSLQTRGEGFCNMYKVIVDMSVDASKSDKCLKDLPELWAYKPKKNFEDGWWFPRSVSFRRRTILKDIIESMENSPVAIWYRFVEWFHSNVTDHIKSLR